MKPKSNKTEFQNKKRKLGNGGKPTFEEWKQKKEYDQYCQETSDNEDGFIGE